MHIDHLRAIFPATFHLVCMKACHLLAFGMLAFSNCVFARFLVAILLRIDLIPGIVVSSCKLRVIDVPHAVVLVLFLQTEFRVFFDVFVVLLGLVGNDVVVVALFHENIFFVEVYQRSFDGRRGEKLWILLVQLSDRK
jgi:hypothetical protein